jgi:PAS domain S-box-containing protein
MDKTGGEALSYEKIGDNLFEGLQVIGYDWRYFYINPTVEHQSKKSREELLGRTMMEIYPGVEQTEMFAGLKRCMETRVPHRMQNEFQYPDGSVGWFELMMQPVPEGVLIFSLDVTELKKTELALRSSEERFRKLFEYGTDAYFISDLRGTLLDINKVSEELTGYFREELLRRNFQELNLLDSNILSKEFIEFQDIALGGATEPAECTLIRKDGKRVNVNVRIVPVTIAGEKIIIVTVRDIYEQKRMEEMLFQSEKMASLGTLAAGIAHEINNPLGYVDSNLNVLRSYYGKVKEHTETVSRLISESQTGRGLETILSDYQKFLLDNRYDFVITDMGNALDESIEGVQTIKQIVAELKEFAHPEKREVKLNDINNGIDRTLQVIWNELKYRITVIKDYCDLPKVPCDIHRLKQVFMNLIMNAVQVIEGLGTITIKTFVEGDNAVIQISDTGKGIPPENMSKIFDTFYTTKEHGKGTGLGLSVVYKVVQEHKGMISVESEVGKGTTFTIQLPIRRREEK